MSYKGFTLAHKDTVAGGEMIVKEDSGLFGGFFLNGSAGSSTISIYDGAIMIYSTSAGANASIPVNLAAPIACTTSILSTCSGTGFYSVFFI